MAENTSDNQTKQPPADAPRTMSFSGGNDRRRRGNNPPRPVEEKQFDERTLHIDRVARVVMGGRRFRFRALVVAGDHKGRVGVGLAKGADVSTAVTKATDVAKKQMIKVAIFKGTLPHEVETKVGGARVLLKPASAGTGLIAGGAIRSVLEVAGVTNVLSKSLGSSNQVNIAYATIKGLSNLVPASKWVTNSKQSASKKTTVKTEEPKPNAKPAEAESKAKAGKPKVSASKTKPASTKKASEAQSSTESAKAGSDAAASKSAEKKAK